ncbi:MAG: amidohydrolase family protein, partial [Pseudonocardiaceae bacterium]|nr:amidohydrolase family protein [Pseudonocardiaceae bacterium]
HAHLVGHSVLASARAAGRPPGELYFDVLVAERLGTSCLMHVGHEGNVRAIMRHPAHIGGSDGLLAGERPHPRAWGTFPRYLGHYVRELGVLGLEECVAHLTGRAARRLRLTDRGLVREGYAADLVLFDPATVADRATFAEPRQPAVGIPYVLVNGVPVIEDGRHTGALTGHSIRNREA